MGIECVAYNCRNKRLPGSKLTFHQFPLSRPLLLKKWICAVRRRNFKPSKCSLLCSQHFTKESFQPGPRLNPDAVPTIFSFSVQKSPKKRKILHQKQDPDHTEDYKDAIYASSDLTNVDFERLRTEISSQPVNTPKHIIMPPRSILIPKSMVKSVIIPPKSIVIPPKSSSASNKIIIPSKSILIPRLQPQIETNSET